MKATYHAPSMSVVKLNMQLNILEPSVTNIDGNAGIGFGGGGNGGARSKDRVGYEEGIEDYVRNESEFGSIW